MPPSVPAAELPTVACVGALVHDTAGRLLLIRRGHAPHAGLWSLPGGRVEPGETLAEAALRELMEEVGVAAEIIGFNAHVEAIRRAADGAVASHFVIASFVGRWRGGEPRPGPEADAVTWADPFDLRDLAVTDGLAPVLRQAAAIAAKVGAP
jgi:8-oxo-dGTP diphosphatase